MKFVVPVVKAIPPSLRKDGPYFPPAEIPKVRRVIKKLREQPPSPGRVRKCDVAHAATPSKAGKSPEQPAGTTRLLAVGEKIFLVPNSGVLHQNPLHVTTPNRTRKLPNTKNVMVRLVVDTVTGALAVVKTRSTAPDFSQEQSNQVNETFTQEVNALAGSGLFIAAGKERILPISNDLNLSENFQRFYLFERFAGIELFTIMEWYEQQKISNAVIGKLIVELPELMIELVAKAVAKGEFDSDIKLENFTLTNAPNGEMVLIAIDPEAKRKISTPYLLKSIKNPITPDYLPPELYFYMAQQPEWTSIQPLGVHMLRKWRDFAPDVFVKIYRFFLPLNPCSNEDILKISEKDLENTWRLMISKVRFVYPQNKHDWRLTNAWQVGISLMYFLNNISFQEHFPQSYLPIVRRIIETLMPLCDPDPNRRMSLADMLPLIQTLKKELEAHEVLLNETPSQAATPSHAMCTIAVTPAPAGVTPFKGVVYGFSKFARTLNTSPVSSGSESGDESERTACFSSSHGSCPPSLQECRQALKF